MAEVEHLYCVPEIIGAVGTYIRKSPTEIQRAIDVIAEEFGKEIESQIFKRSSTEIREKLGIFSANGSTETELLSAVSTFTSSVDPVAIFRENKTLFEQARSSADPRKILKLFNRKNLYKQVSARLGFGNSSTYIQVVLGLLRDDKNLHQTILNYLRR